MLDTVFEASILCPPRWLLALASLVGLFRDATVPLDGSLFGRNLDLHNGMLYTRSPDG